MIQAWRWRAVARSVRAGHNVQDHSLRRAQQQQYAPEGVLALLPASAQYAHQDLLAGHQLFSGVVARSPSRGIASARRHPPSASGFGRLTLGYTATLSSLAPLSTCLLYTSPSPRD